MGDHLRERADAEVYVEEDCQGEYDCQVDVEDGALGRALV